MHPRTWHFILFTFFLASCQRTPHRVVLVELERADGVQKGTELRYRGVLAGHVESVTLTEPQKKPVARVALAADAPSLATGDEFRLSTSGLLGDPFIEVIPATSPGPPLANAATVQAQGPRESRLPTDRIMKTLDSLNFLADLQDIPEPKRVEVLDKIRKLLDEAKKESTNK